MDNGQLQLYAQSSDPSWRKIDNLFDAIYFFAQESVALLLEMPQNVDINECSTIYSHTPLIACIHCNNYEAAWLLLNDDRIDVNRAETAFGWSALHECVRFGRDKIAQLLLSHKDIDIWIKSTDNDLPLDIGNYLGHDNKCQSLIDAVHSIQYKVIKEAVPILPDDICKELTEFIY